MARKRLRLVILCLVLVPLALALLALAAPAPGAARAAGTQVAPEIGLAGQEGGESYSVVLQGAYAYLGIGPRLVVLNVSAPSHPVLVGRSAPLPDIVQEIAASGAMAYVVGGESGLHVVDVSNLSSPEWKGSLDTPGWAHHVAVAGDYAYVADGDGGLRIVNVSDPLNPAEVGSVSSSALGGEVKGITVAGNTAYVGAGAGGLVIVDVTAPASPAIRGRYLGPVATSLTVLGTTAYMVDSRDLKVLALNVSSPSSPQLVDSTTLTGVPDDLRAVGSYLYLAVGEAGMDIFQIDPATGQIVSYQATHDTPGVAHDMALSGLYAYVADGRAGLRIVDVLTDPHAPVEVGAYRTLGDALAVAPGGSYAYVAAGEDGLSVVDISDLTEAAQAGSADTPGYAQEVVVAGSRAYVADGYGGLAVVDVANPAGPVLRGQRAMPGDAYAWAVAVQDNYAYLAAESEGMQIVRVSNPAKPSLVGGGFKPAGASVWGVAVAGNYAYLAAGLSGVRVVNISDPAAPQEVAAIPTGDWAQAVALAGGTAYIADIDGGLRIADVTTPADPVVVTTYTGLPGAVLNVTVSGKHALVATEDSVHILDISVPASPVLRASYKVHETGFAPDVAVGDAVLVTDYDGGLRVLNPADVAVSATMTPAQPEPAQPLTLNITVANHGPSRAGEIQLTDTLPAGMAFVSASPSCTHAGGVVTCAIGSLAGGASADVSITVTPPGSGTLKNRIVVSSSVTEINEQNNAAEQAIVLGDRPAFLPLVVR